MKITAAIILCLICNLAFAQTGYKQITISNELYLVKLSDNAYVHVSNGEISNFGKVPSNGLVFIDKDKAFLFDTPVNDSITKDLVKYIQDSLKARLVGFAPNHWHIDCMGGLNYLQSIGIDSYANEMTISIAKSKNLPVPAHAFRDSLKLKLNDKDIILKYPGPAHTIDNITVWIPSEKILFAGCMVKTLSSPNLGNIADGDLKEYPITLTRVLEWYPDARIVVPGHGDFGGISLIKHTLELSK
jgi:metallo-beta-lactamase class B